MTWLLDNPDESLEYMLADSGFDVWIANTIGTRWSLKHQSLNPTEPVSFLILLHLSFNIFLYSLRCGLIHGG